MKKIILLSLAGALALNVSAQQKGASIPFNSSQRLIAGEQDGLHFNKINYPALKNQQTSMPGAKTTAGGNRWISYYDFEDAYYSMNTNQQTTWLQMWQDSTIRTRFSTGYGTINWSSVADVIYPPYDLFNDPTTIDQVYGAGAANGLIGITRNDSYTIDSVYVDGNYFLFKPSRTQSDQLVIAISPATGYLSYDKSTSYTFDGTHQAWVPFYTSTDTVIRGYVPYYTDSVNRTVSWASTSSYPGVVMTKNLNPATDGDDPTASSVTIRRWAYALPSPITVPAGAGIAISATFKSTDTWAANSDTINGFNHFMPFFGYEVGGTAGGWMTYAYGKDTTDRNGSSLMFSTYPASYEPALPIQGWNNQQNFRYQHLSSGIHVVCSTCNNAAVGNVNSLIAGAVAYPNPAGDEVAVSFKLNHSSDVTVNLMNEIGQVVSMQHVGNMAEGKAIFNTSSLATGLYFYSVEADGQRKVGRLSVVH
jgi:hypothetical protein